MPTRLVTDYPIAVDSPDHLKPFGAAHDDTHCLRFLQPCEARYPNRQQLRMLDLGCAGGGLVLDFVHAGHIAVGLEGSDCAKKTKRAAWGIIPDCLFTCDITKVFALRNPHEFEIIGAWGVLEHIAEKDLLTVFGNVARHLAVDGIFCGLVGTTHDGPYHQTVQPQAWWEQQLQDFGFRLEDPYAWCPVDYYPRGSGNGKFDYNVQKREGWGFHFVACL